MKTLQEGSHLERFHLFAQKRVRFASRTMHIPPTSGVISVNHGGDNAGDTSLCDEEACKALGYDAGGFENDDTRLKTSEKGDDMTTDKDTGLADISPTDLATAGVNGAQKTCIAASVQERTDYITTADVGKPDECQSRQNLTRRGVSRESLLFRKMLELRTRREAMRRRDWRLKLKFQELQNLRANLQSGGDLPPIQLQEYRAHTSRSNKLRRSSSRRRSHRFSKSSPYYNYYQSVRANTQRLLLRASKELSSPLPQIGAATHTRDGATIHVDHERGSSEGPAGYREVSPPPAVELKLLQMVASGEMTSKKLRRKYRSTKC